MKKTTIFVIGIVFLLTFIGCQIPQVETEGSLKLTINNKINSKTLVPGLDIEPASYRITGSGPEGTSFDENTANSDVTIGFLRFGDWTINIEAFNAEGTLIATGTANAAVHVGDVTPVGITIRLLEGTGTFNLGVSWYQNEVENPSITGVLKSSSGSDINLTFFDAEGDFGTQNVFADTGNTVPVGYYTLIVKVHDLGASGTANHLALGAVEIVRILKNETTYGDYYLQGVPGMGKIDVNIEQDFDNPINVSIISAEANGTLPQSLSYDGGDTFSASAFVPADEEDAGNITYVWYLNSETIGVDRNITIDMDNSPLSTTVNGKFAIGNYRLDVTAFNADGSRAGSANYQFEVTGNPGQIIPEDNSSTGLKGILFVSDIDGDYDIYHMNEDGSDIKNLTNTETNEIFPEISPDGTKIVFSSQRDGNSEIYVMNSDGSNQINISNAEGLDTYPSWSPDGTKILFSSDRTTDSYYADIHIMNADGSNPVQLADLNNTAVGAAWSPDGSKIAFIIGDDIGIINPDGTDFHMITDNSSVNSAPKWSPDGSKILFSTSSSIDANMYTVNPDGSNMTIIADTPEFEYQCSWSPDGSKVIYSSNLDGSYEIHVMSIDGTYITQLTDNNSSVNNSLPDWR